MSESGSDEDEIISIDVSWESDCSSIPEFDPYTDDALPPDRCSRTFRVVGANSKLMLAHGDYKPVVDIESGDELWTPDGPVRVLAVHEVNEGMIFRTEQETFCAWDGFSLIEVNNSQVRWDCTCRNANLQLIKAVNGFIVQVILTNM